MWKKETKSKSAISHWSSVFCLLSSVLCLLVNSLYSQQNFTLSGNIGLGYYGQYPFLNREGAWHYSQKFVTLNFSGYIWDPRFMVFTIGGDYSDVNYGQNEVNPDFNNIGYQFHTRFFPQKRISFGLRYGKRELSFEQIILQSKTFKTHYMDYGFDFYLSRIKILPMIRLNYTKREFLSTISQSNNELEKRIDLIANKTIGKSYFDLNYRYEDHKNQFFGLDRTNQNLRVTDRIEFGSETMLWFNGIFSNYSTVIPTGIKVESNYGLFSTNFLKRFSSKLVGNFIYNFTLTSGDGYKSRSHNIGMSIDYNLRENIILTPEIYYFTDSLSTPERKDYITEPKIGLKLSYQTDISKIRLTSICGIFYRNRRSKLSGEMKDFSQFVSMGISTGKIETLLASLSYQYNGIDTNISEPSNGEYSFFIGIGRKQDNHRARLELRSRAVGFLDLYFYSHYDKYRREGLLRGITDTQTLNNGLTIGLKGLTLTADYGISKLYFGENTAEYNSFTAILDVKIFKGLDFRAQRIKRYRIDIFFMGDYELIQEAYLRYNLGRFSLSVVYRRLEGKISGIERQDEAIFIRFSRSFGMNF
ncbi:MAG: hypothetical protein ACE5WD_14290 [Candidatus Aminicenantia bacterium]